LDKAARPRSGAIFGVATGPEASLGRHNCAKRGIYADGGAAHAARCGGNCKTENLLSDMGRLTSSPTERPSAPRYRRSRRTGVDRSLELRRFQVDLNPRSIDSDVKKVVRRLDRFGHQAYLVGGCVRDLLLERQPKDFDVATSALPEQVRSAFRNSRIIGRRFRLVHVTFPHRKIIEVATFRRDPREDRDAPQEEDEWLIRSDNVFGEAHEDARRRDFTINGLFYHVQSREILDWVGGMDDIQRRVVRTIGDPETRFREDPVRVLRAIKFAGRLDLGIDPEVYDALLCCRHGLQLAAKPRVAEEVRRLLGGGQARRSVYIAWETGVLDVLLPELAALLCDGTDEHSPAARVWRQLAFIDRRHQAGSPLDDEVLWTLLLLELLKEVAARERDRGRAVGAFLTGLVKRLTIPKRITEAMRRIVVALPRILQGRPGRLARSETYPLALDVAQAELFSAGLPAQPVAALRAEHEARTCRRR